jgi:hypothetical protein
MTCIETISGRRIFKEIILLQDFKIKYFIYHHKTCSSIKLSSNKMSMKIDLQCLYLQ